MHPSRKLLQHFEGIGDWPIEPADVQKWVIDHGYCDEFLIHYVDCDARAFDGMYVERQGGVQIRHAVVYGEPIIGREIFINERQTDEDRRIAEVKETLHVLDLCTQKTTTLAGVNDMIAYAATRMKLGNDDGAVADIITFPLALAVLFPWPMRQLLKPKYDADGISADELAKTARLPEAWVELIMSERWESTYATLMSWFPAEIAA